MTIAYEVLAVYAAIVVWIVLLVRGFRGQGYRLFLGWGVAVMLVLNLGYFVRGQPESIAFFIGIYDFFDNLGLGRDEGAPALAQCVDNTCTVWGDRFVNHPSWGVAFHERFLDAPATRTNLLYLHIFFNSVAFVLLHVQLWRTGLGEHRRRHTQLGRVAFGAVVLGTIPAAWLASEHGEVGPYGGLWAEWGFYSMSAFVLGTAVMSVVAVRRGDVATHRIWAIRWAGAMWGAFWLFRVMLVFTGPLLRNWESASILISIWFSAPLGILIAEAFRVRGVRSRRAAEAVEPTPSMA